MKLKEWGTYTIELDKDEINAIIYGLSHLQREEFLASKVEYWGLGGMRQFNVETIDNLVEELSHL